MLEQRTRCHISPWKTSYKYNIEMLNSSLPSLIIILKALTSLQGNKQHLAREEPNRSQPSMAGHEKCLEEHI